jgi:hypothetical protein
MAAVLFAGTAVFLFFIALALYAIGGAPPGCRHPAARSGRRDSP